MLFLDANAFYYYYGSSKLGQNDPPNINITKLRQYCDNFSSKALPSSAYLEIITHFKDSQDILTDIINFIITNKFKIYNNTVTYNVTDSELSELPSIISNEEQLQQYVFKVLIAKKETEVSFSNFFLCEIVTLYTYFKIKQDAILPSDDILYALSFVYNKLIKHNNDSRAKLHAAFDSGYEINDPQRVVKKVFVNCVGEICIKVDIMLEWIYESFRQSKEVDINDIFEKAYSEATKSKSISPEMDKIVKVIKNAQTECKSTVEQLSDVFDERFTQGQKEYLSQVLLPQWLMNGQKFQKNDIFDFFWISCLDYISAIPECTQCLTFDTKLRRFIKTYRSYIDKNIASFIR